MTDDEYRKELFDTVNASKCVNCKHCKKIVQEYRSAAYVYCPKMSQAYSVKEIFYCKYYKEKKHK